MKPLCCLAALLALMACEPRQQVTNSEISPRQQPTTTKPGVTVSGYATVGVKRGL